MMSAGPQLPPEIWSRAFDDLTLGTLVRSSHVCSIWRSVARQHPTYWRHISFTYATSAACERLRHQLSVAAQRNATMTVRVGMAELGTHPEGQLGPVEDSQLAAHKVVFGLLLPLIARLASLEIHTDPELYSLVYALLGRPAPLLEVLSVCFQLVESREEKIWPPIAVHLSDNFLSGIAQKLHTIELRGLEFSALNVDDVPVFPTVRRVHVTQVYKTPLLVIAHAFPNARDLALPVNALDSDEGREAPEYISRAEYLTLWDPAFGHQLQAVHMRQAYTLINSNVIAMNIALWQLARPFNLEYRGVHPDGSLLPARRLAFSDMSGRSRTFLTNNLGEVPSLQTSLLNVMGLVSDVHRFLFTTLDEWVRVHWVLGRLIRLRELVIQLERRQDENFGWPSEHDYMNAVSLSGQPTYNGPSLGACHDLQKVVLRSEQPQTLNLRDLHGLLVLMRYLVGQRQDNVRLELGEGIQLRREVIEQIQQDAPFVVVPSINTTS